MSVTYSSFTHAKETVCQYKTYCSGIVNGPSEENLSLTKYSDLIGMGALQYCCKIRNYKLLNVLHYMF